MSSYETPKIRTMPADRVVELMGPVSCGSGQMDPLQTPSKMGPGAMTLSRTR